MNPPSPREPRTTSCAEADRPTSCSVAPPVTRSVLTSTCGATTFADAAAVASQ
nr:hypothetical protein [Nocardia sp. NRRL S-836]